MYSPILKTHSFNPNPVAGNIPLFADSRINESVVGTRLYEEFWQEQANRCLNGFKTGGLFIPGRYYYYLNFFVIDSLWGKTYPHYVDLHYELFTQIEDVKKNGYTGIIWPKGRRKGISFFATAVINHGLRFIDSYKAGVAAGHQTYVDKFRSKLYDNYNNTVPEMRLNHLKREDEFVLGYDYNTPQGMQRTINGTVLFETMRDDASKLEGEFFHDVILEEVGEFPLAYDAIMSIKPALRIGSQTVGSLWCFGTGGKMTKGGKVFQKLWNSADVLGLQKMFIPGRRFYYPHYINPLDSNSKLKENNPVIAAQMSSAKTFLNNYLGCEDVDEAQKDLDKELAILIANGDTNKVKEHLQDYPNTIEDVFISGGNNKFNSELLYKQRFDILGQPRKYTEHILDFEIDKNGQYLIPYQIKHRPATHTDKDWQKVKIYQWPSEDFEDVIGIDGYQMDDSTSIKRSLGGVVVGRRYDLFTDTVGVAEPGKVPICTYYGRPPRKEQFWEIALKISILFGSPKNVMGGVDADAMINYFKHMGCKKYLSPRPKSFDAPDGRQIHDIWFKATSYSKPIMMSLAQSWIEDDIKYCHFEELIDDFTAYDEEYIHTDWDLADAWMHCLIRMADTKKSKMSRQHKEVEKDPYEVREWVSTEDGIRQRRDNSLPSFRDPSNM